MERMSVVIRLKVPIEMHYTVIPMGTSKVNSSLYLSWYNNNYSLLFAVFGEINTTKTKSIKPFY